MGKYNKKILREKVFFNVIEKHQELSRFTDSQKNIKELYINYYK
jgi:hypothetical protein